MSHISAGDKEIKSHKVILFMAAFALFCAIVMFVLMFYWPAWKSLLNIELEHFGQFGDYLGGVINPVVGLLTIVLLTNSMRQNREALAKANEELELTRAAIDQAKDVQEKTEAALTEQILISRQARDINNAVMIWGESETQLIEDLKVLNAFQQRTGGSYYTKEIFKSEHIDLVMAGSIPMEKKDLMESAKKTADRSKRLSAIIEAEIDRLEKTLIASQDV